MNVWRGGRILSFIGESFSLLGEMALPIIEGPIVNIKRLSVCLGDQMWFRHVASLISVVGFLKREDNCLVTVQLTLLTFK